MERTFARVIIVGDLAKAVYEEKVPTTDTVEAVVEKKEVYEDMIPMLKEQRDFTLFNDKGCEYKVGRITVKVSFVDTSKYFYLTNPDQVFFHYDSYYIPNPFGEYWEHRNTL